MEHPQLQPSVEGGPSGSLGGGRGAGKLEISVPHQDVEVPTKSYRKMNNLGTFWNEIRQNVARNQNEILTEKNVCTEFLTKLSDSEESWMEI